VEVDGLEEHTGSIKNGREITKAMLKIMLAWSNWCFGEMPTPTRAPSLVSDLVSVWNISILEMNELMICGMTPT